MQTLTSEPSALRVPKVKCDIHTNTLIYEYISVHVDGVRWDHGECLGRGKKEGKAIKKPRRERYFLWTKQNQAPRSLLSPFLLPLPELSGMNLGSIP